MAELDPRTVYKACTRFLLRGGAAASRPETVLKELAQAARPEDGPDGYGEGGLVAAFVSWHMDRGLRSLEYVERTAPGS